MYLDVPGNTTREATITHLKGYTVYTITVLAYTVVGDGVIGNEVPVRTHEWGKCSNKLVTVFSALYLTLSSLRQKLLSDMLEL